MYFSSTVGFVVALVATASAQEGTTIKVTVGKDGLVYTPSDIIAEVGTNIEFDFYPKNHSVTQSSFKDPCHPLENGFFSTFVPTANSPSGTTFTITVQDTKPIWLYCGQGTHCQTGMVASINAPTTGNTFEAFKLLAKNATASTSPAGGAVVGGVLKIAGAAASSGSAALSSTISTTKIVQTTVTATITATITNAGSTYATTYPSTYGTTYTTAVPATTLAIVEVSGTSTSSSASASATGNSAAGLAVNGGMAGAIVFAAFAML